MAYVQLGDICNVVKGEIGITKAVPGDYPMVTTAEFRKSHNKFQLDTEAVLVPLVSATGHGHASIKRVHYQEGKFAFGSILAACVPKDENYSAKFLYIYFNLMKDLVLVPLMKGSANVSLTLGNLKKAKVPKISLQTQLEIVELYTKIKIEKDKVTDLLTKQEKDINSLRQAILQEAVQGKLTADWRVNNPATEDVNQLLKRIQKEKAQLIKDKKIKKEKALPPFTKDEIPYELPEGWVWCRLGNATQIGSSKRIYESDYVKIGVPFYRSKEIGDFSRGNEAKSKFYISNEKYLEISRKFGAPNKGDLLITSVGSIGNTWIADDREFYYKDGNITQINRSEYLNTFFIQFFVKSPTFMDEVLGKVSGTAYSALTITKLKSLMFMFPPLEEQKAIVEKVNTLMELCDVLEQEVQQNQEYSEQLMQSVLRAIFEGVVKNK